MFTVPLLPDEELAPVAKCRTAKLAGAPTGPAPATAASLEICRQLWRPLRNSEEAILPAMDECAARDFVNWHKQTIRGLVQEKPSPDSDRVYSPGFADVA